MEYKDKSPLNKRHLLAQNVFILVCREWLRHMKELKPNKIWNKLKFGQYSTEHSLTRRLAIAFYEKECENDDQNSLLPDRFRQYWRTRKIDSSVKIFDEAQPVLFIPNNYQLPIFTLNNPFPTLQSAYSKEISPGVNQLDTSFEPNPNSIQNIASTLSPKDDSLSTSLTNNIPIQDFQNSIFEKDYELCLNTLIDYLKYGTFATKTNSLSRIALIVNKTGYSNEMQHSQYDFLVNIYCDKVEKFQSSWESIEAALNQKIISSIEKYKESIYESPGSQWQKACSSSLVATTQVKCNNESTPIQAQEQQLIGNNEGKILLKQLIFISKFFIIIKHN